MNKTLFINSCIYLPGEKATKRTFFLFDMMRQQNYPVHFLTSDFNHYEKKERDITEFYRNYPEYADCVSFVKMKPYKKNISFARFFSNFMCDVSSLKWFKENGKNFDIVYISWPASFLTRKIKKYCDKYNVKIVLDINDLWPDSLKLVFKNDIIYNILTCIMRINTSRAYSYADGLVAVSNEYLAGALSKNKKSTYNLSVYIGAMLERFDAGVKTRSDEIYKPENEIWVSYIGTIGRSYDFETVMQAVSELKNEKGINIRFKILGKGPEEERLKNIKKELSYENTDFVGFLEYELMAAFLNKSDICVNCIKKRASQSVINKVSDYFAAGKPVINCGPCLEMSELISEHKCGINYNSEDVSSCKSAIISILENTSARNEMEKKSRKLAEEKFDRKKTHQKIIHMLENI